MPTTSKYVFVQKNSNGQYTTYGSVSKSISGASSVNPMGNFVVLTAEPMNEIKASTSNTSGSGTVVMATTPTTTSAKVSNIVSTSAGDNDDNELRPLAWLNDSNLIKGIVTSDGNQTMMSKTATNNICIVNAADAHELIEELPHHVASEEHVATTVLTHVIDATNEHKFINSNDNQQQQHQQLEVVINGETLNNSNNNNNTHLGINDFQKQFIANASKRFSLQPNTTYTMHQQHAGQLQKFSYTPANNDNMFNNLPALGSNATTTVHVGPSGTTTVVEYKTTGNFKATAQKQKFFTTTTTPSSAVSTSTSHNNNIKSYVTTSPNIVQAGTAFEIIPHSNNSNNYNNKQNLPQTAAINFVKSDNYNVANSNHNTNNNYGQTQKQNNNNNNTTNTNTNANNTSTNVSSSITTTHHPHKKYLREKMSVFKEFNNNNSNDDETATVATTTATTTTIIPPTETLNLTTINNKNNNDYNNLNNNNTANEVPTTIIHDTNNKSTTTYYNLVTSNVLGNSTNIDSTNLAAAAVSCTTTPTATTALTPNNLSTASYVTVSNNDIPAYTIVNSHQIA